MDRVECRNGVSRAEDLEGLTIVIMRRSIRAAF